MIAYDFELLQNLKATTTEPLGYNLQISTVLVIKYDVEQQRKLYRINTKLNFDQKLIAGLIFSLLEMYLCLLYCILFLLLT